MAVIIADDKSFDRILGEAEYTVVDFYGDNCGGCVYMEPFFREAANDMPFIQFVKVNAPGNPVLKERFHIQAIPDVRYFRNGQEVYGELGGMNREELNKRIAKLLYE